MTARTTASSFPGAAARPSLGSLRGRIEPMTDISHSAASPRTRLRRGERWEFHALVGVTYPLFLAASLAERAAGRKTVRPRRSVFAEAYATAEASLACAFMG